VLSWPPTRQGRARRGWNIRQLSWRLLRRRATRRRGRMSGRRRQWFRKVAQIERSTMRDQRCRLPLPSGRVRLSGALNSLPSRTSRDAVLHQRKQRFPILDCRDQEPGRVKRQRTFGDRIPNVAANDLHLRGTGLDDDIAMTGIIPVVLMIVIDAGVGPAAPAHDVADTRLEFVEPPAPITRGILGA